MTKYMWMFLSYMFVLGLYSIYTNQVVLYCIGSICILYHFKKTGENYV